jgi:hypothetical protein
LAAESKAAEDRARQAEAKRWPRPPRPEGADELAQAKGAFEALGEVVGVGGEVQSRLDISHLDQNDQIFVPELPPEGQIQQQFTYNYVARG